jgi:hypothetical protein
MSVALEREKEPEREAESIYVGSSFVSGFGDGVTGPGGCAGGRNSD